MRCLLVTNLHQPSQMSMPGEADISPSSRPFCYRPPTAWRCSTGLSAGTPCLSGSLGRPRRGLLWRPCRAAQRGRPLDWTIWLPGGGYLRVWMRRGSSRSDQVYLPLRRRPWNGRTRSRLTPLVIELTVGPTPATVPAKFWRHVVQNHDPRPYLAPMVSDPSPSSSRGSPSLQGGEEARLWTQPHHRIG